MHQLPDFFVTIIGFLSRLRSYTRTAGHCTRVQGTGSSVACRNTAQGAHAFRSQECRPCTIFRLTLSWTGSYLHAEGREEGRVAAEAAAVARHIGGGGQAGDDEGPRQALPQGCLQQPPLSLRCRQILVYACCWPRHCILCRRMQWIQLPKLLGQVAKLLQGCQIGATNGLP